MPRQKRPVILKKDSAIKHFDSIASAAKFLGVLPQAVNCVLKQKGRHHSIRGFLVEYDNESAVEHPIRKRENKQYEVEIQGKRYISVPMPDKTTCLPCAILKARPPKSMMSLPLCYEYSLGNHKIVDYCRAHNIIWKEKK